MMTNYIKVPDAKLSSEGLYRLMAHGLPTDQIFQNEVYGVFNMGHFGRLIHSHPREFDIVMVPIDKSFHDYICSHVELNPSVLALMSAVRMMSPLYALTVPDDEQPVMLADGHHRVVKLYQMGIKETQAIVGRKYITQMIQIQRGTQNV